MTGTMKSRQGQVLVELALVLPLLTLFLFGVLDFGRWMYVTSTLNHAAGAGARAAAVMTPPPVPVTSGSVTSPQNVLEQAINQNLYNGIPKSSAVYDVQIIYGGGRNSGAAQSGDLVHVTVRWPTFQMLTPLKSLFSPTLSGDVTVRYE